uniref:Conotoxin n=1 Tax=Conus betulinus TaxID=89764 RepID=A0A142C1E5_CONBE|nr:conotoxin [Conus betulinus]
MTRVFVAMFFLLALTEGWPPLYDHNCENGPNMHYSYTCGTKRKCAIIRKRNGQLTCKLMCKCEPGVDCLHGENIVWDDRTAKIIYCP